MTPELLSKHVLRAAVVAFPLLFAATGCVAETGDEDGDVGLSQEALSCSGGCCGTSFNCKVPDSHKRRGCGGARIRNPVIGGCMWPIRGGADRSIYDGMGTRVGEVRSSAVRLNQGIRKTRDGYWFVYAFNTTVRMVDGSLRPFSGWIRQSDLVHAHRLHGYELELRDPGHGTYETRWQVTGGDRERFGRLFLHGPSGHPYPATDYLLRPYGLVHVTYNVPGFSLGGHATDSFQPGAVFRRSKGVSQIEIPLYGAARHRSRYSLHFVYGYVHDGERRRYGWIAKEALTAVAPDMSSCGSERYCWSKCENRLAYHRVAGVTSGCTDAAREFCTHNDRGAFEDAIWDSCQPR
jgi:hypothetical protein